MPTILTVCSRPAWPKLASESGDEHVVSIVGIDEVDINRHYISWMSPLARALMKAGAGETVVLRAPTKTEELEILNVTYARIPMDPYKEPPGAESAPKA